MRADTYGFKLSTKVEGFRLKHFKGLRGILPERGLSAHRFGNLIGDAMYERIQRLDWAALTQSRRTYDTTLVREFYVNFYDRTDDGRIPIWGKWVEYTEDSIN